jgi:glycosyltransferase involved in cell wall biosynthesis
MTTVFFDHQKFTTQRYGGISRYFATLIQAMKTNEEFSYQLGVLYSNNHYIKDEFQPFNNAIGRKVFQSEYNTKAEMVNQLYCKYLLGKNDFDVFHPTYYDPYFIGKLKKPMVTTIHDMTYERLPEYFWANDPLAEQKRINADKADKIIAISETTKKDLLDLLAVDEKKVEVIYHGIDLTTPLALKVVDQLPERYILFVGDRSGYKNFYAFIRAFSTIQHRYPDVKIILTGGGKIAVGDREFLHKLKLSDRITHIQVSDEELNYLYNKALFFVYPSLYEGFGLPILEAFKAECPILLSDTECFKEIGADAVVYFEQRNEEHLAFMLEEMINKEELRRELVKKGNERLLHFPIQKCVDQTLSLYQSLKG